MNCFFCCFLIECEGDASRAEPGRTDLSILQCNIRGLRSNKAELQATIANRQRAPEIVCLNETNLKGVETPKLYGYSLVERLDRVAVYAIDLFDGVEHVFSCIESERMWFTVHTMLGPLLLCAWYRSPAAGDLSQILSFQQELTKLRKEHVGCIIIGDLNMHCAEWLKFSSGGNSREGQAMYDLCKRLGLHQFVREPTRYGNLLDLVISDLPNIVCEVHSEITDHSCVTAFVPTTVRFSEPWTRLVWRFDLADWDQIFEYLSDVNWCFMAVLSPTVAAEWLTNQIIECMNLHIPRVKKFYRKATHPWVSKAVCEAVWRKHHCSIGVEERVGAWRDCSRILSAAHGGFTARMRKRLRQVRRGSKKWWALAKQLTGNANTATSVPVLRAMNGDVVRDPKAKADLFADMFDGKYALPPAAVNQFTELLLAPQVMPRFFKPTTYLAKFFLRQLSSDSATGPDEVPAYFLHKCADYLAEAIAILCQLIFDLGEWPDTWRLHRVFPLFKQKGRASDCNNYRGLHLTSHISKVVERMIKLGLQPFLHHPIYCGENQFAYIKQRGARDALTYLMLIFLEAFALGKKIGVYCADVAAAFDRVKATRLYEKLVAKGLPDEYLRIIRSWLFDRTAYIEINGQKSRKFILADMVFQGTVLGPSFWIPN